MFNFLPGNTSILKTRQIVFIFRKFTRTSCTTALTHTTRALRSMAEDLSVRVSVEDIPLSVVDRPSSDSTTSASQSRPVWHTGGSCSRAQVIRQPWQTLLSSNVQRTNSFVVKGASNLKQDTPTRTKVVADIRGRSSPGASFPHSHPHRRPSDPSAHAGASHLTLRVGFHVYLVYFEILPLFLKIPTSNAHLHACLHYHDVFHGYMYNKHGLLIE